MLIIDEKAEQSTEQKETSTTGSAAKISTIPMTSDGKVKHEDPMIPTLPPISAKGVGSKALEAPFVLPATPEGKETMAKYAVNPEKEETSFQSALNKANDIPVAPIIDRASKDESTPNEPVREESKAEPASNTVMADADVEIIFADEADEPEATETEPEIEPEIIPEPEEEPVVEEPAPEEETEQETEVEPQIEPVEEPEIEAEIIPEPEEESVADEPAIEEAVFTDAEHADELMTDEEAEEHIEIIEETPGKERKGKMHVINLDTICDAFEDGETVTIEVLKAKNLAPKNAGRVKILARGTMTKKLEIVADSFSLQAVKMITLAGGRAEQFK